MPFVSQKPALIMSKKDSCELKKIAKSRTESLVRIERARIFLAYSEGKTISSIARSLITNRVKVNNSVNKAIQFGVSTALKDLPRKGRTPIIKEEAKNWFLSIACRKPKELGISLEVWTMNKLAEYIRLHCIEAGYPCLQKLVKGTASKILNKSDLKPHKVSYYLERKDPNFNKKMAQVLHVYKEVKIYNLTNSDEKIAFLSYDEKPGIQAIENLAPDLPPIPGKYPYWKKDYEYKRHGTVSLLSSIDLLTGKILANVFDRHRSSEFIEFLKYVHNDYPKDIKIKMILDNNSCHISKETRKFLETIPNRFEFIFTPTHASWLNIIEVFFSKMTRSFLRRIRVKSKIELKQRIIQYINEINQMPTIFRWKWKMDEIKVN